MYNVIWEREVSKTQRKKLLKTHVLIRCDVPGVEGFWVEFGTTGYVFLNKEKKLQIVEEKPENSGPGAQLSVLRPRAGDTVTLNYVGLPL